MGLMSNGARLRELAERLQAVSSEAERHVVLAMIWDTFSNAAASLPAPDWLGAFWAVAERARALSPVVAVGGDRTRLVKLLREASAVLLSSDIGPALQARLRAVAAEPLEEPPAPATPIAEPAPEPESEPVLITELAPEGEPAIVELSILELCYRGRRALARAVEVRDELLAERNGGKDAQRMQALVDELLDLVPLALQDA